MAEGEGLLKEAKELLWGWRLPPVVSVGMGGVEMDQLGKCSKAIEVSHPILAWHPYPVNHLALGVGGIDKFTTSVFLEKILRYYYIPTTGIADLQAPLNTMLRGS